ncbi:hypothetical protein QF02_004515 [Salmonella enterica subsp. enterica]|nr:hypothetical protein [Salmonella enterica subsp. enterica serovar Lexington]
MVKTIVAGDGGTEYAPDENGLVTLGAASGLKIASESGSGALANCWGQMGKRDGTQTPYAPNSTSGVIDWLKYAFNREYVVKVSKNSTNWPDGLDASDYIVCPLLMGSSYLTVTKTVSLVMSASNDEKVWLHVRFKSSSVTVNKVVPLV